MAMAALVVASAGHAQPKPVGAYSAVGEVPTWVTFGAIDAVTSDSEIAAAVRQSKASGFAWIVQFGFHVKAHVPVRALVPDQKARLERLGLWPFVVAVIWNEEWHERCLGGEFAEYGLVANSPSCGAQVVNWLGRQHAELKAITGKPVVWVTGMVTPDRLVPPNTDYAAIDFYPQDGQSIETLVPVVLATEQSATVPLVIIPRWFETTGHAGPLGHPDGGDRDHDEWARGYAAILARPQWVAMMGFLWHSRHSSGLVGLADLPEYQAAVKHALGVR